ncbi:hypothetical protein E0K89_016635 [Aquicoccus sp. SCR17]|nr:hypothetical protein [Carideicomes alvinocaridis]
MTCERKDCTSKDDGPLGPRPRRAVLALADLGLQDAEIARYYRVSPALVHRLRVGRESGPVQQAGRIKPRPPASGPYRQMPL